MTDDTDRRGTWDPFPSARLDSRLQDGMPSTPQTRSPTYRLAFDDDEFLTSAATRGLRLQLELMKAENGLSEAGILSTIVLFGGARIPEPGKEAWAGRTPAQKARLEANSHYYDAARHFARLASLHSAASHGGKEFVIVTGGGPGVMEAGNRARPTSAAFPWR